AAHLGRTLLLAALRRARVRPAADRPRRGGSDRQPARARPDLRHAPARQTPAGVSTERVGDPYPVIVLPVVEVFRHDDLAAQHASRLDDRGIPVGQHVFCDGARGPTADRGRDAQAGPGGDFGYLSLPGGSFSSATMCSAIAIDAVAAGDGALRTVVTGPTR